MAAFLGVHPETVVEWVRAREAGGGETLAAKPHPGRTPFLIADQGKQVLGWLADRLTTHGFRADLWTARRVADLIHKKLNVRFHPHHLREWLTMRNCTRRSRPCVPSGGPSKPSTGWLDDDRPRLQK